MATRYDHSAGRRFNYTFALAGLTGVGKTSTFKYIKSNFEHARLTSSFSDGLDCCIFPITVDGVKYQITLYDTGGLERFNSLTSNYYQRCQGIILVYSNNKDKGETVSGLAEIVESAIGYNKAPDLLVFALWGTVLGEAQDTPLTDLAASFAENNQSGQIPKSLMSTICPSTGMGIRDGLTSLVRAVAEIYKPRADSILAPEVIEYSQESSHELSVIGPQEMEMSLDHQQRPQKWYKRC